MPSLRGGLLNKLPLFGVFGLWFGREKLHCIAWTIRVRGNGLMDGYE